MGIDTEKVELSPQEANFLLGERCKKNPLLWFKDGFFFFFLGRSKVSCLIECVPWDLGKVI